jgi:hypothetical protein
MPIFLALIILALTGQGVTMAADRAQPGDALYPVKVYVSGALSRAFTDDDDDDGRAVPLVPPAALAPAAVPATVPVDATTAVPATTTLTTTPDAVTTSAPTPAVEPAIIKPVGGFKIVGGGDDDDDEDDEREREGRDD